VSKFKASIIILTKNPERGFPNLLDSLLKQNCSGGREVIVIDSGSDNEVEALVKPRGMRYIQIDPGDFSHGDTRNKGVQIADGHYIVFLTQDALPADNYWLQNLIEPMERDPKIVGVFSRQIPKEDTHPMEKYFLTNMYGENSKVNAKNGQTDLGFDDVFFSNVSSAIRRDVALAFPFNSSLVMSEDQDWSKRTISAGWKTAYAPDSIVIHSHQNSIIQVFKRNFDSGASLHHTFKKMPGGLSKQCKYFWGLIVYLLKKNEIQYLPVALVYETVKALGFALGWYERFLPAKFKVFFGFHREYWLKAANRR